ncbi:Helicase associated domain protein [Ferrimonas marina]|uniref:Superfamily II DNA or RNA helicase n=1 Tax=Ferrimonas marina TaxID=299255 RepID=A0A1M5TZI4_9GAMM|nr:Helicase associated domain protein [Ferrimonas marina]SHH55803.1 Superfamily II DNA or RNA helicase [Ferrimonas marina]
MDAPNLQLIDDQIRQHLHACTLDSKCIDLAFHWLEAQPAPHLKGLVAERFIAELYRGLGYLVRLTSPGPDGGADLLLYDREHPDRVAVIVQCKAHAKPLGLRQIASEYEILEREAAPTHHCKHFRLVSLRGFVKGAAERFESFKLALVGPKQLRDMMSGYNPASTQVPAALNLLPHNLTALGRTKLGLVHHQRVGLEAATGTGKNHIIQPLCERFTGPVLFLCPSTEGRVQQEARCRHPNTTHWTYCRLREEAKLNRLLADTYELVILDELPHTGAPVTESGLSQLLNLNPSAKVVSLCADPVRHLDGMRNMMAELRIHPVHLLPLDQAIARKILPAPTIIAGLYDFDDTAKQLEQLEQQLPNPDEVPDLPSETARELRTLKGRLHSAKLDWQRSAGVEQVFADHIPNLTGKFIVFCETIDHLVQLRGQLHMWYHKASQLKPSTRTLCQIQEIHSGLDTATRRQQRRAFLDAKPDTGLHLLLSVDMLSESVHLPDLSGVIMLRCTSSPSKALQQLGRCLSCSSTDSTPLVLDLVNNLDNLSESVPLGKIQQAVDEHESLRAELGMQADPEPVQIRSVNLIQPVKDLIAATKKQAQKADFWRMLGLLRDFQKESGSKRPDNDEEYRGYPLGMWCTQLRLLYRQNRLATELDPKQLKALHNIDFCWSVEDDIWQRNYQVARDFHQIHGHLVLLGALHKYNKDLSHWLDKQRSRRSEGTLSSERCRLLDLIDMQWNREGIDIERYGVEIKDYIAKYGPPDNPTVIHKGAPVGMACWLINQLHHRNELSHNGRQAASDYGFNFEAFTQRELQNVERTHRYLQQASTPFIRYEAVDDEGWPVGVYLAFWRYSDRKNLLSPEVRRALAHYGILKSRPRTISELIQLYTEYREVFPDRTVPPGNFYTACGYQLCARIRHWRMSYENGRLGRSIEQRIAPTGMLDGVRPRR